LADGLFWHRGQFALTITFHYLFPPLTMALAVLIAILKGMGLWKGDERYHECARF
jgi:cytochrome d ubiquinol oxidase subunit I